MNLFLSGLIALILAAVSGVFTIPMLARLKFGQSIRDEGPAWHQKKSGTPTIGGVIFIIATAVAAIVMTRDSKVIGTYICGFLFGAIGFCDDYIKVVKKRNLGLTAAQKFLMQLAAATCFILFVMTKGENPDIFIPFANKTFSLGILFLPLNVILMVGIVNSVNLTDGLDGLAAFSALVVAIFFAAFAKYVGEDISILMAALAGALIGFLIYNIHPAKVFMGDTGSLFLGGILSAAAVYLGFQLILIICCMVFIIETLSVMIQVTSFKLTGKRVFKMSPIHHHFEMCGFKETKIVLMFTVATALFCLIAFLAI